jgi:hypothetical protein
VRKWLLPILGLWAFQVIAAKNDVSTPPEYAGAYAVRFCRESCAAAASYRTGTLVLLEQPLRDAQGRTRSKWLERGPINGCLILDPVHGIPDGWAFRPEAAPRRFLAWSAMEDHSMRFELFRTPDAGYVVRLRLTPAGLGGTGMVWMDLPGNASPPGQDAIQAHRIGDADQTRCPRLDVDADAMEDVLIP